MILFSSNTPADFYEILLSKTSCDQNQPALLRAATRAKVAMVLPQLPLEVNGEHKVVVVGRHVTHGPLEKHGKTELCK